ncbi:MAG TPA: hypothetical protein VJN70_00250, partial [Gemmatimonadaceae bacterium]|nr:hypothetical protein [Gemmatimonadaceae bacterium]
GTLGPTAVAFFTDSVFRNPLALRYSLAIVNVTGMLLTMGLLWFGMSAYRRTIQNMQLLKSATEGIATIDGETAATTANALRR